MQINELKKELSIIYFKGSQVIFPNYGVFLFLKTVLNSAKSIDLDKKRHIAFHLGIHCLQKYPFRGFHNIKGLKYMRKSFLKLAHAAIQ